MDEPERISDASLHPRDILLRDSFTQGELLLFGVVLFFAVFSAWLGDPDSLLLLGGLLIAGGLCPFILKTHERTHPFFIDRPWVRFLLLTAPAWIVLLFFLFGLFQSTTATLVVDKTSHRYLKDLNPYLPATTLPARSWLTVLAFLSLHSLASFLYMIPKTRIFTERLFPWLCLNAVLIALFGILWKIGFSSPGGFAFYPHDGHWSAFAILWTFVCFGMAFRPVRREPNRAFVQTTGPWYLFGAAVLTVSGIFVESAWPSGLQFIAFSVALLFAARQFLFKSDDPDRKALAGVFVACGIPSLVMGAVRISGSEGAPAVTEAAVRLVLERPLFGWGINGVDRTLPFFMSDWSLAAPPSGTAPGALDLLASLGLVGLLPFLILIVLLLRQYLRGQHDFLFSRHLLTGCVAVLCLLPFDSPLRSPGLVFSLWLVFFTALRWTELSRTRADEVDTRPQLVTPAHQRRVPFYTGPVKERLR